MSLHIKCEILLNQPHQNGCIHKLFFRLPYQLQN